MVMLTGVTSFSGKFVIYIFFKTRVFVCINVCQKRSVKLDFFPETYRLEEPKDRQKFTEVFKGLILLVACFYYTVSNNTTTDFWL